jgi:hypothetical protein
MTMSEWFETPESMQSTEPQRPVPDFSNRYRAECFGHGLPLAEWYEWAKFYGVFLPEEPR